jgi:hypothetical protein
LFFPRPGIFHRAGEYEMFSLSSHAKWVFPPPVVVKMKRELSEEIPLIHKENILAYRFSVMLSIDFPKLPENVIV